MQDTNGWRRVTAGAVALLVVAPFVTLPAQAQIFGGGRQAPVGNQRQGMSGRKKVVMLAGAALLYYLYKKHTAANAAQNAQMNNNRGGGNMNNASAMRTGRPQLYRSRNGGVYYRNAQGRPVWLTVPSRGVQVPQEDLQRYAPDYNRYRGPAPAVPRGYGTQDFSQFDPSLTSAFSGGNGSSMPPGPRGGLR